MTDTCLAPGSAVDLKLSFYQQPRPDEIEARVVWSRRAGAREKGFEGLPLHGVQFTLSSAHSRNRVSKRFSPARISSTSFVP